MQQAKQVSPLQALEAGKLLHIKEHTVLDAAGKGITLCAPVECKGIVGSDDRFVFHLYVFADQRLFVVGNTTNSLLAGGF